MAYGFDAPAKYYENAGIDWYGLPTYDNYGAIQQAAGTYDPSQLLTFNTGQESAAPVTLPAWMFGLQGFDMPGGGTNAMSSFTQRLPNDPNDISYYYQANNMLAGDGGGYSGYIDPESFIRIRNDDLYKQAVSTGKKSILNGRGTYDLLDKSGNVVGTKTWEGLKDEDHWDSTIQALVGIALGGAAAAGAGAGAGASAGTGAGVTGLGDAGMMYAGADAAAAGTLGGGASVAGGASLGSGLGAAGAGAAGLGAGITGLGDAGAMYAGLDAASAATLGGGASVAGGAALAPALTAPGWMELLKSGASQLLNNSSGDGFDWTKLIGPATQLIGGKMGADAAKDASAAQLQAAREAMALNEPFRLGGIAGMNKLLDGLGLSSNTGAAGYGSLARDFGAADFQADPGYAFRQSEGEKALQRAASAGGLLGSGKYLKDSMKFNQDLASQEYGNAYNRFKSNQASRINPLQSLMGAGQTAANTVGEYATQAGNAQAAGTVGKSNAWTNALNQGYSMYSNNNLMNRLLGAR